jgi:hypothetical protein
MIGLLARDIAGCVSEDRLCEAGGSGSIRKRSKWRALAVGPVAVRTRPCAGLGARPRRPDCLDEEEATQHAVTQPPGAVGRTRWPASHPVISLTGSGIAMLVAGLEWPWLSAAPQRNCPPPGCSPRSRSRSCASHRGSRRRRGACRSDLLRCICSVRCQDCQQGPLDSEPFAHILRVGGSSF